MKINGLNQPNYNPYKQQINKQVEVKHDMKKDQIEISNQAKQLQEDEKPNPARSARVEKLKEAVEAGEYKLNYDKTAEKMIDFWSGK
ncbi:hypothetical protein GCM10008934_17660 [Virgibacillus salarius]|uniref:flagellar biosynthesis anti-sigma factor FlgM n=1 Tax=Virgibacillus salarius TaxID=447199 RepID=UPI0031E43A97